MTGERSENEWAQVLTDAIKTGVPVAPGGEHLGILDVDMRQAATIAPDDDELEQWGPERTIPSAAVRLALLDSNTTPDPHGLQVHGCRITGSLDLVEASLDCRIVLSRCQLDHDLEANGLQIPALALPGCRVAGINLDGARVDGGAFCAGLQAAGEVRALGAHIGGQLGLQKAVLSNRGGNALNLDGAQVDGGAFWAGLVTAGDVRAVGAHIAGELKLQGAVLSNPGGSALILDGARVDGGAFWAGLRATGEVRALGAHFDGQLGLQKAVLSNRGGNALSLDAARVDGAVFGAGLQASGEVRALGAHIGGQLGLQKAVLSNRGGNALNLDGAQVDGGAFWAGLRATGEVRAVSAHIGGQLDLEKVVCRPLPSLEAVGKIDMQDAVIGTLFIGGTTAKLDLHLSHIQALVLQDQEPPSGLEATGWTLTSIRLNGVDPKEQGRDVVLTHWLDKQEGFVPQPWHEAADALARDGHVEEATRLRIAAAKRSTKQLRPAGPPTWSVRAVIRWVTGWFRWLLRHGYGLAVAFGYRPLRAGLWLAAFGLVTLAIVTGCATQLEPARQARPLSTETAVQVVDQHGPLTGATDCQAAREGWDYPCLNKWLYAAETALPVVGSVQSSAWVWSPGAWLAAAVVTALKALAWLFTVLLLGGVTNLLRKT
ncbi:hypothetical protein GCM10011512_12840 [Tersicoccus solisilvae]|uniref:Membrane-associated oxidoreductase n=1 Tax=Tersicoccus solisilvae TaxID=1882339 RepID=A0ABQ1NYH1_9MICC|nr:hypothetical protein [Tersicoccus solisilvae]GGC87335.1 hypothetical protein GCM10011512_12840 [Tersicoccus solisilvae]